MSGNVTGMVGRTILGGLTIAGWVWEGWVLKGNVGWCLVHCTLARQK